MRKTHALLLWWLPFLGLCLCAYWIQINLYLHKDVAIITHTAAQMLEGQTYGHDIFEPNPPLIFYLHFLPVLLAKFTGIKIIYVLRLIVLVFIMLSIFLAHDFLKKLFTADDDTQKKPLLLYSMSYALAFVFLFLPAESFAQREHFFIILILPYILLAACRLNKIPIAINLALLVGIMAGIGFSIKPFFLTTFLLIEGLLLFKKTEFRSESIIAIIIIIGYMGSVILFYPSYLNIVLPLWMPYYLGIRGSWINLITAPLFLWCCAALFMFCSHQKKANHYHLKQILAVSILGTLITYLLPQVAWYYHILPAISFSFLYFALWIAELITHQSKSKYEKSYMKLIVLVIFWIPMAQSGSRIFNAITYFHTNSPEQKLMYFLDAHSHHNHYMFLSMTHNLYDLEFYTSAKQVGRFSSCTWEYTRLGRYSSIYKAKLQSHALKSWAEDLNQKKPEFIILDQPSTQAYLKQRFDYIEEYNHHTAFHEAWSHYRYKVYIKPYDIYQRIS